MRRSMRWPADDLRICSPHGAQRNAGTAVPDFASLHLGYEVAPTRSAREFLVLDAVRDGGVGAEPAHLVGLVVLEVALEPLDMAVALEGEHVGRDAVEEPAIVADDHRAAGEILQRLL